MKRFALVACRWSIWTTLAITPIAFVVVVAAVWHDKLQLHRAAIGVCCLAIASSLALALAATAAALIEKKRSD